MTEHRPDLLPKLRSDLIMSSMRHFPCTLRIASFIPGHACAHQSTVVGCHLPVFGKGMSTKVTDMAVAAGCAHCHALIEGVDKRGFWIAENYPGAYYMRLLNGLVETHAMLVRDLVIDVPDGRLV